MKCSRQARWWPAIFAAGHFFIFPLAAQVSNRAPAPVKLFSASANQLSLAPRGKSPVDFFRQLLAMTPDEREVFLTNRPPEIRARIFAKVAEYAALDPDERELRLRATDLRWYLTPLLRLPPAARAARVAQIPEGTRGIVQARLDEWAILPPSLQQEFLDNERVLHYFASVDASNSPVENFSGAPSAAERARWDELSEPERRQIAGSFNQFFDLTPDEKQTALNTLSDAERRQMEKTLQTFDKMPASQRDECVNAFARFASLTAPQQAEFLKNAERWAAMSPAERQAWRDLVVNVPQWPPLPVGFVLPVSEKSNPAMATNKN